MGRKKKEKKPEETVQSETKKSPSLNKLLSKFEKKYGAKKASEIKVSPRISTGIFPLDILLGGGISVDKGGHIIEYYGKESSCKTAFSLKTIASFQKLGKSTVFINAEGGYPPTWAETLGVDNDKLLIMRPESLEQAGEMLLDLMSDNVDLVVIDSIPALIPEEELGKTLSEKTRASQAKVNSPLCRKIQAKRTNSNTSIIFINQIREGMSMYGNNETTPGGRALKHLYDTRINFRTGKFLEVGSDEKKETIGMEVKIKAFKNKKGIPRKSATIIFYTDGTVNNVTSTFYEGVKFGVIQQNGQKYIYEDLDIRGKDNFMEALTGNQIKEIQKEILLRYGNTTNE